MMAMGITADLICCNLQPRRKRRENAPLVEIAPDWAPRVKDITISLSVENLLRPSSSVKEPLIFIILKGKRVFFKL